MKTILQFLWLGCLLLSFSCQPDDDMGISDYCLENAGDPNCPNYDPCFEIFPATSNFDIIDSGFIAVDSVVGIPVDTSFASFLYFRVNRVNPLATYEWQVGQDPRVFTGSEINLNFNGFEGTVNVRLTETVPSNNCLAENDLISTSTKSITIVDSFDGIPTTGIFNGELRQGNNTIDDDLTITITGDVPSDLNEWWKILGLAFPEDCINLNRYGVPYTGGYSWLVSQYQSDFSGVGFCSPRNPVFIGRLTPGDQNEITIDYWLNNDNGKRIKRTFVGRRIQ
ncbi:MAG: hypothetical protein AAFY36_11010 [Bacteroidota bacterium]